MKDSERGQGGDRSHNLRVVDIDRECGVAGRRAVLDHGNGAGPILTVEAYAAQKHRGAKSSECSDARCENLGHGFAYAIRRHHFFYHTQSGGRILCRHVGDNTVGKGIAHPLHHVGNQGRCQMDGRLQRLFDLERIRRIPCAYQRAKHRGLSVSGVWTQSSCNAPTGS